VVTNAPFSADAVTTVTQVLGDGTRIEQSSTARFYRDNAGRVRREQTILGLAALNPSGELRTAITIDPDPNDALAFTLDPATRTARRVPRATPDLRLYFAMVNDGKIVWRGAGDPGVAIRFENEPRERRRVRLAGPVAPVASGAGLVEESLGTRQIEGVAAVGWRTKSVIPTGQIGNDRAIEIIDSDGSLRICDCSSGRSIAIRARATSSTG
jgi:hypothetical protein